MMREAQRMMQDPNFQLYMKQVISQQKMQQAIQTTKETIADRQKLQQLEMKTKLAIKDGEKKLKEIEKQQLQNDTKTETTNGDTINGSSNADSITVHNNNDELKPSVVSSNGMISETVLLSDDDDIPTMPVLNLN
jgi:hypothetical protein